MSAKFSSLPACYTNRIQQLHPLCLDRLRKCEVSRNHSIAPGEVRNREHRLDENHGGRRQHVLILHLDGGEHPACAVGGQELRVIAQALCVENVPGAFDNSFAILCLCWGWTAVFG